MPVSKKQEPVIAVALSGGIDSLYTLLSLHKAGVKVMGVHGLFAQTLNLGSAEENSKNLAQSTLVINQLAEICKNLQIPFAVIDCADFFLQEVVRPFATSYALGQTPNPCAICNANIKFGKLLQESLKLGATHLATGHYARLVPEASLQAEICTNLSYSKELALLQGSDAGKDQSYFLALVPKEHLAKAIFPLGSLHKKDVMASLAEQSISPPQKAESQEVCFIPQDEYRDFLPRVAKLFGLNLGKAGKMLLTDGRKVGTHKGLWQYTEGQRKGLGIGWSEPLHVLGKELEQNVLRLGTKEQTYAKGCLCKDINILLAPELWPTTVFVKTRYREKAKPAQITFSENQQTMTVLFEQAESRPALGQIAAIYIPVLGCFEKDGRPILRLVAGGVISGVII